MYQVTLVIVIGQHTITKKLMPDSPGLADFAVRLVDFIGEVKV